LIPQNVQTQLTPPTRGSPPPPLRSGHKSATSGTRYQLLSGTAETTLTLMPNHFNNHLSQIGHLADEDLLSSETSQKHGVEIQKKAIK
jgi:hypothetical protein